MSMQPEASKPISPGRHSRNCSGVGWHNYWRARTKMWWSRGLGQQIGSHRMGGVVQERKLSRSGACGHHLKSLFKK